MRDGEKDKRELEPGQILIPSRYYAYRSDGGRYPLSAMADFAAENGFSGVDLSLDRFDTTDDGLSGSLPETAGGAGTDHACLPSALLYAVPR